jgi:hypothetical protein
MIVVAHAGHWAVQLAYLAPIVAMVLAMLAGRIRDRRS